MSRPAGGSGQDKAGGTQSENLTKKAVKILVYRKHCCQ
jgi:hypothetical protein